MNLNINDTSFKTTILNSNTLILVNFWAPWCMPCSMTVPIWEEIQHEYSTFLKIVKINTDENPTTAMEYNIRSIPTLLIFKKGKLLTKVTGVVSKSTLVEILHNFL